MLHAEGAPRAEGDSRSRCPRKWWAYGRDNANCLTSQQITELRRIHVCRIGHRHTVVQTSAAAEGRKVSEDSALEESWAVILHVDLHNAVQHIDESAADVYQTEAAAGERSRSLLAGGADNISRECVGNLQLLHCVHRVNLQSENTVVDRQIDLSTLRFVLCALA